MYFYLDLSDAFLMVRLGYGFGEENHHFNYIISRVPTINRTIIVNVDMITWLRSCLSASPL